MLVDVVRGCGQREERGRRLDETRGQRKLGAELVHGVEVVVERDRGLRPYRVLEGLGGDERISVAIAADPRAHAHERRDVDALAERTRKPVRKRVVQARNLGQERVAVVRKPVVDFVAHRELRQAKHCRLPQRKHLPLEIGLPFLDLLRRELGAIAQREEAHYLALAVEDALALHFRRVRRQYRTDQSMREPMRERLVGDAGLREVFERGDQSAALRRRARQRVRAPATVLMNVLG